MKTLGKFLKATLAGGLLVLFPLFGSAYLVYRLASVLVGFIRPLMNWLPGGRDYSLPVKNAAAIALLLLLCFLIGLLVRTSAGKALGHWMETHLLSRLPGFIRYKQLSKMILGDEEVGGAPVFVNRGAERQIGFLIEENSSDELTVFMPIAPGLRSGSVIIVKAEVVERLNVPASDVARVLMQCGVGAGNLSHDAGARNTTHPLAPDAALRKLRQQEDKRPTVASIE